MQTIIAVMHDGIDETQIRRAGDILKEGGLVAFPTETVYGLGGNALDAQASAKDRFRDSARSEKTGGCILAGTADHDPEKIRRGADGDDWRAGHGSDPDAE